MYQQPQQADAAQVLGVFQTPALDGDPSSFQISMPRIINFMINIHLCSKFNHPNPCFTLDD